MNRATRSGVSSELLLSVLFVTFVASPACVAQGTSQTNGASPAKNAATPREQSSPAPVSLEELSVQLKSPDQKARVRAAVELAKRGTEAAQYMAGIEQRSGDRSYRDELYRQAMGLYQQIPLDKDAKIRDTLSVFALVRETARLTGDRPREHEALIQTGLTRVLLRDYDGALVEYLRAAVLALLQGDKIWLAKAALCSGEVFDMQGKLRPAATAYGIGLALYGNYEDEKVAASYTNLGNIQQELGLIHAALLNRQRSLAMWTRLGRPMRAAETLMVVGETYRMMSDFIRASDYYARSRQQLEKLLADTKNPLEKQFLKTRLAYCHFELGEVCHSHNRLDEAVTRYTEATRLAKESNSLEPYLYAIGAISEIECERGKYQEARDHLAEHLKYIAEKMPAGDKRTLYERNTHLSYYHKRMGNVDFAEHKYREAHAHYEQSLTHIPADSPALRADVYCDLANLEASRRNWDVSLKYANQAERLAGGQLDTLWKALTAQGRALRKLGQGSESVRRLDRAIGAIETMRRFTVGGRVGRQQFFEDKVTPYQEKIAMLVGQHRDWEALSVAERARARVVLEALQPEADAIAPSGPSDFPGGLEQGSDSLVEPGTALLEYVVATEQSYVFVITKPKADETAAIRVVPLDIPGKELEENVRSFRKRIADRDFDFQDAARSLYDKLIGPVQADLKSIKRFVIVPDGALWELPFAALQSAGGKFLIEGLDGELDLSYAPSLQVLRELRRQRVPGPDASRAHTLLALGDPLLSRETIERVRRTDPRAQASPLPAAGEFVEYLVGRYAPDKSRAYTGSRAHKDVVKDSAGEFWSVVIAAHGYCNELNPLYSAVLLAHPPGVPENAADAGFLEARELLDMKFRHTQLVVLATCQSARGRIGRGEGMIGLTWALSLAGCPSTVASLWDVDVVPTKDLLTKFYDHLIGGRQTKARAFCQAQRDMIGQARAMGHVPHPQDWAGFVLVGDGR